MFGNGNSSPTNGDFSCLNNVLLPRERRRTITGYNDAIFGGGTLEGVQEENAATSNFDCGLNELNCFGGPTTLPLEVADTYLGGDEMIENTGGYYLISAEEYPVDDYKSGGDGRLDTLTAQSDLPGHFFFVTFLQDYNQEEGFASQANWTWGMPINLDWLARIAQKTDGASSIQEVATILTSSPTYYPTLSTGSPTYYPTLQGSTDEFAEDF